MTVYPADLDLDIAGAIEGTDKSSSHSYSWGYLRSYARMLSHLRFEAFNFLEIGALGGSSLRLWRNFFPKATIIGLDINESCRSIAGDRIVIEIGSQVDPEFIGRIGAIYHPTVIIDDASHQAGDIVFTFEHLFEFLPEGGVYIIEDASLHFGSNARAWNKSGSIPIEYYFQKIAESLMAKRNKMEGSSANLQKLYDEIESVAFISGAVVVHKRVHESDFRERTDRADKYLASINNTDPEKYVRLAEYLLKHTVETDLALQQTTRALELDRNCWRAYFVQALILERADKLTEAVTASRNAVQLAHANATCWAQMGRLQLRAKDVAGAVASLERAHALRPADAWISEILGNARNRLR